MCYVTESGHSSGDLPPGGLEVPFTQRLRGSTKDINKVIKLLEVALSFDVSYDITGFT